MTEASHPLDTTSALVGDSSSGPQTVRQPMVTLA